MSGLHRTRSLVAMLVLLAGCRAEADRKRPAATPVAKPTPTPAPAVSPPPQPPPPTTPAKPPVNNMSNDQAWNDAEAAVRQALEKAKIGVKELRRSPGANVRVFGVTTSDDKAMYAALAGTTVHFSTEKKADSTVEAILKSEHVLDRSDIKASDIILIVHAFGTAPDTIKATVDRSTTGRAVVPGHPPTLTVSSSGGHLEIFALRPGRRGAEAQPMDHLYKGILTISSAYKVQWKVESVDLPAAVP